MRTNEKMTKRLIGHRDIRVDLCSTQNADIYVSADCFADRVLWEHISNNGRKWQLFNVAGYLIRGEAQMAYN